MNGNTIDQVHQLDERVKADADLEVMVGDRWVKVFDDSIYADVLDADKVADQYRIIFHGRDGSFTDIAVPRIWFGGVYLILDSRGCRCEHGVGFPHDWHRRVTVDG